MEDAKLAQDFLDSQVWGTWGSGLMGPPRPWHLLLGLSMGPETRASWVLEVEKTWGSLSKSQPGSNEDVLTPPQVEGQVKAEHECCRGVHMWGSPLNLAA